MCGMQQYQLLEGQMQFRIEKMGCGGCAKTISSTIHTIDPGAKIDIDLATKRVDVTSDANEALLQQALADAGYPAERLV